ncbi:MAG: multidrug effflux MFS transporter [Chitinophagaceae bacterium]|nr:multidrug effflux MFS transporter [Chitinophagaceae bacterium]
MTQKKRFITILLLGLLTAIVPFTIDMYLPGFPDIARSMNTTVSKVALSLSSFFIGMGLGQLMYGPLLDRFGRKKPLYAGLLLYCITSIGCAYAGSIEILILLRFIQAIGACSATISATAMVRDIFPAHENAKIFSFLILVLSTSPMLAPSIGSWLIASFGWTSIFFVLTALIIVIFLGVLFFLPESKGADKKYSLHISSVLKNYRAVLRESYFVIYAIIGGIGFAGLFAHISSSPGVFMEHFALSQKQYGLLFAFLASGLIIASQINTFLLKSHKSEALIARALIFQNCFSAALLIVSLLHVDNFWIITGILFLYLSSIGLVMPNASALSMKPFEQNAGSASALLGFIQMGLGSLATVFIGVLNIKTVLPLAVSLLICSILGLCLITLSKKFTKQPLLIS